MKISGHERDRERHRQTDRETEQNELTFRTQQSEMDTLGVFISWVQTQLFFPFFFLYLTLHVSFYFF